MSAKKNNPIPVSCCKTTSLTQMVEKERKKAEKRKRKKMSATQEAAMRSGLAGHVVMAMGKGFSDDEDDEAESDDEDDR
jgi:hypothetical protein